MTALQATSASSDPYHDDVGLDGGDERAKILAWKIKEAESVGDRITHETIKRLRENWITPLDREDIHQLISRMDDVLDDIEEAAARVVIFEVHVAPPEARALAEILLRSCETIAKAVGLLRRMTNAPAILELCVHVNSLENEADVIHRRAIADLFRRGNAPLMVMKWRDIFDSLEAAADRCEDVANVVEEVVLEYA
jgi:predicted phosphate transport protein (TIGR00153 family)